MITNSELICTTSGDTLKVSYIFNCYYNGIGISINDNIPVMLDDKESQRLRDLLIAIYPIDNSNYITQPDFSVAHPKPVFLLDN